MKTLSTFNFRSLPGGFLVFIATVLIIECAQVRYDYFLYRDSNVPFDLVDSAAGLMPLQMKVKNDDAWRGKNAYDVIVLGDSSAIVGVSPDAITAATGLSAYNDANYIVEGIRAPVYLLNNVLNHAPRPPRYVVVCLTSISLFVDKHRDGVEYTYIRGNRLNILKDLGLGPFFKAHIPTLHHQTYFRNLLANPGQFGWPDIKNIGREIDHLRQSKGTVEFHPDDVYSGSAFFGPDTPDNPSPSVPPLVEESLREIIRRANAAGAKVLLLVAPRVPSQFRHERLNGFLPKMTEPIQRLVSRNVNATFLDVQKEFMNNRYFVDCLHLNREGSAKLNAIIAQAIIDDLAQNSSASTMRDTHDR